MIILIFGEAVPKQFAMRNNEAICIATAGIIRILSYVFLPIIWIINGFARLMSLFSKKKNRDFFSLDSILHMVKHAEKTYGDFGRYYGDGDIDQIIADEDGGEQFLRVHVKAFHDFPPPFVALFQWLNAHKRQAGKCRFGRTEKRRKKKK